MIKYCYITNDDVQRIYDDIVNYSNYNEFEYLKSLPESILKAAITEFCDVYYGFTFHIENIAEELERIIKED